MDGNVHIPLRDYMEDQERNRREWMLATFATKSDLAIVRSDVAILKDRYMRETRKTAATWGGAGTAIGAAIVTVLAYFGIRPHQP